MATVIISKHTRPRPIYAFNGPINGDKVTATVERIRKDLGIREMNQVTIYVLSGTRGDNKGNPVGEGDFYQKWKLFHIATVKRAIVNESTPESTFREYFDDTKAILVLAWGYSDRWPGLGIYNR